MSEEYALTNPLTKLTDKPREDFTREDLLRVIQARSIQRITFRYTALDGKLKALSIPVTGRAQAERVLADGERVDGSSLFKGLIDAAVSDLYVVPAYKTAFLNPFDERSLDIVCRFLTPRGELAPYSPDNILRSAYERFRAQTGAELHALGELEFFLLRDPETALYKNAFQRGYHSSGPFSKTGDILNEMLNEIAKITGVVKYAHGEVGYIERLESDLPELAGKEGEQVEIEFLPSPIDDAADHLVIARWLIRMIAYKNNCLATFTPKLEEGSAGSGLHVHMELRKSGKNIMLDKSNTLSAEAKALIGGLCEHADSLTAFGNTVASSYLRLVPHQEAPVKICWSDMNRSALIRVPLGWRIGGNLASAINPKQKSKIEESDSKQTVELRSPDGSANSHLLLAGITMAAEWGLMNPEAHSIADHTYIKGNIFDDKALMDSLRNLPKSCAESARIIVEKRHLYERDGIFPPSMIEYAKKLLEAEEDEHLNAKLAAMPKDERRREAARAMHKDLHRH